jgi:WD40 repeat protein
MAVAGTGDAAVAVTSSFVDGAAIVWDLATGERLHTLEGHREWVRAVAVTGDGAQALTASDDTTAIVWDLATGERQHTLVGHKEPILAMAVTADGTWAVTTSQDGMAIVWDLHGGRLTATWQGDGAMSSAEWALGKPVFVAGSSLGAVSILRLRSDNADH